MPDFDMPGPRKHVLIRGGVIIFLLCLLGLAMKWCSGGASDDVGSAPFVTAAPTTTHTPEPTPTSSDPLVRLEDAIIHELGNLNRDGKRVQRVT